MTLRPWLLTIAGLVTAVFLSLPFLPQSTQPFDTTTVIGEPAQRILPSSRGVRLPDGLEAGDRLYFADMPSETRLMFMVGSMNPPVGTPMHLRVTRGDQKLDVTVPFMPTTFLSGGTFITLSDYALTALAAVLGLLLLWRGKSRATLGVALWCYAVVIDSIFTVLPLPFPWCAWLSWSGTILENVGTLIGLYLVADALTGEGALDERIRSALRYVFSAVVVVYLGSVLSSNLNFYSHGVFLTFGAQVVPALHLLGFLIPLGLLIAGYRHAPPVNRARIRWILFSMCALLLSYVEVQILTRLDFSFVVINLGLILLKGAAFTGFTYAVLRHSLVSVGIVLNRALVYGLITSLVVGVFAALLAYLERTALSTETNRLVALVVPLILGMGLNAIKRQVDERINKLFFRRRHRAEEALSQFARTSAYVEDPERLLDLAADELHRNSGAQALGIYLSQPGKGVAALSRRRGMDIFPAVMSNDDPAYLRLRAGDAEVELHSSTSRLGREGFIYALAVRGEVMGFIVCGPRPAEAYSPEERRLYITVAQQVGMALHTLRLQEQQRLLRELADGAFKSLPTARARARSLISLGTT